MNNEKAREFFSAYYEGTLDFGLQQSFEQKLRNDSELMADYAAFVETMNELDAMRYEEIEVPSYLSDRIATRVEQVAEKSRAYAPVWTIWLRGLGVGVAATAALAVGFIAISNFNTGANVSQGSMIPAPSADKDRLNVKVQDGKVMLQYRPSGNKTIVVSSGVSGSEIRRIDLDGTALESPLENKLADTALFDVQVVGDERKSTIAVPGSSRATEKSGTGDLKKFAAALAGFYRVPVLLQIEDSGKPVTWEFTQTDARDAASAAVTSEGYSVDQRPNGLIVVMDR